jgi:transcriptional regulator with GAF, ATPase, and Fis domain
MRFELRVADGSLRRVHSLPHSGAVVVGRDQRCDIPIEHPSVSRLHARLHTDGGNGVVVEDLGSANGSTLVEGRSVAVGASSHFAETSAGAPGRSFAVQGSARLQFGSVLAELIALESSAGSATELPSTRPSQAAQPDGAAPIVVSSALKQVYAQASRIAQSDLSLLIQGETGTGKELLAEFIHRNSPRASGPLVRINCGALTESLLESELFGYERGAFTGAERARVGLLESAQGGTVFLDELGELSPGTQSKLLRTLEDREIMPVGSVRTRPVDVRFIGATHRELLNQVQSGAFRADLYYRIGGFTLRVPPLRERTADVLPIVRALLARFASETGRRAPTLTPEAERALEAYPWPGNVRELKNAVERAVVLARSPFLLAEDVVPEEADEDEDTCVMAANPASASPTPRSSAPEWNALNAGESSERDRILEALERCAGNQTRAAALLGLSRRQLSLRLDKYGLVRPQRR